MPGFSFSAKCLLALLLLTDAAFILLHLVHVYTPFLNAAAHSIEHERGYAEVFQYIKCFWIILLLAGLALKMREWFYGLWMLLFLYLLGDDASQYHERGGKLISNLLDYEAKWGLRAQDFGELSISLLAFVLFVLPGISAYKVASPAAKAAAKGYVCLLALLVFFGIGAAMLNIVVGHPPIMDVVEDGGELLAISLTCWYIPSG